MARVVAPSKDNYILPIDDALISGPSGSLDDLPTLLQAAEGASITSILAFAGTISRHVERLHQFAVIQNLSASTTRSHHTHKVLVSSVENALVMGADAVAAHLNLSAEDEPQMIADVGAVASECRILQVPLLVISYPRRADDRGVDDNYAALRDQKPAEYTRLVCHAARVAADLGADIVKVPYTGSVDTFSEVVRAADGARILVAGGSPDSDDAAYSVASEATLAGACGVAFGRYTFQRPLSDVRHFVQSTRLAMRHEPREAKPTS